MLGPRGPPAIARQQLGAGAFEAVAARLESYASAGAVPTAAAGMGSLEGLVLLSRAASREGSPPPEQDEGGWKNVE